MTASRDPDRLIRAFLDEGQTELPDRSFDAVRAGIERTRQRTVIGPERVRPMLSTFRPAALLAAGLAIAVIGVALVARPSFGPGESPPPGATATAPPGATATTPAGPTATAPAPGETASIGAFYAWPLDLQAGTYGTKLSWKLPFFVAFTVPAGWVSRDIEVIKGDGMSVSFQLVENTYADPCPHTPQAPVMGGEVDDFVLALGSIDGVDAGAPHRIWRSGFFGQALQYTAADCGGSEGRLWSHPADLINNNGAGGGPYFPMRAGIHDVEILDINGTRLVINSTAGPNPTASQIAELEGVVASIRVLAPPRVVNNGDCSAVLRSPAASGDQTLAPPFRMTMGMGEYALLGIAPEPQDLPVDLPNAHVDFVLDGISFVAPLPDNRRPSVGLVPPMDSLATGFGTLMTGSGQPSGDDSYVGSVLLDAPGTWFVFIEASASCVAQFPIEVLPMAGG